MITAPEINSIKIQNIKIKTDATVLAALKTDISKRNILAVGEAHGVKENADVYYDFFHKFSFDTIALEYPDTMDEELYSFVKEGVISEALAQKKITDGRFNLEYLFLIKQLWNEQLLKSIICFSTEKTTKTWNERDAIYAQNFLNKFDPKNKTLLIAGNYHTRKDKFFSEYEQGELEPMCYHLKDKIGDFPECTIEYHSGSLYNFEIKTFTKEPIVDNYLEKTGNMQYKLHLKEVSPITIW